MNTVRLPSEFTCSASCGDRRPVRVLTLYAGTWWLCTCGASERLPWCDGAHSGTAARPIPLKLSEPRPVRFCGCGRLAGVETQGPAAESAPEPLDRGDRPRQDQGEGGQAGRHRDLEHEGGKVAAGSRRRAQGAGGR